MADSTITIRRQVLDVEVAGTQADGLALQRRLPGWCADVLSPALETELARFDPGDAHLFVERLEVDVPQIGLDRLEAELADAVRAAVADFFRKNPPGRPAGPGASGAEAASRVGVQLRAKEAVVADALVAFLRTGRLPWSFLLPAGMPLEQYVVHTWSASAPGGIPPSTLARLVGVLASGTARNRLMMQFSPPFVRRLLRAWSPALVDQVEQTLTVLDDDPASTSEGAGPSGEAAFTRGAWEAALAAAAEGRTPETAALARTAWQGMTTLGGQDRLGVLLETRWPGVTQDRGALDGQAVSDRAGPERSPEARRAGVRDDVGDGEDGDGILVDNAGLVILHPFVPRLFEALEVTDGDALVDPARALCLLHFLATGELTAPEHRLTLAKVLCDVPIDRPVEADVGLTGAEASEANALLEAAVRHWGALRGSSRDALRGEYLMRPGTLAGDVDGGWLLRIESRASDILLDQLPWGITLVQLPWMPSLMSVEWR